MKHVTKFLFFALIVLMTACENTDIQLASNDGGISGTGDGTSLLGSAHKGPFVEGSVVKIHKVVNGNVSEEFISTSIASNKGDFVFEYEDDATNNEFLSDVTANSVFSVSVEGQFYNEVTGELSNASIELKALVQLNVMVDTSPIFYVNSLTHLAHDVSLLLLKNGSSYREATTESKARVLNVLSEIIAGQVIQNDFANISIINSSNTLESDNKLLLYISSLFSQATLTQQQAEPNSAYGVQDLLSILIESVNTETDLDTDILELLQTAQEELNTEVVIQNLLTIFTKDDIPGLPAPENFTMEIPNDRPTQRAFCYDGSTDCGAAFPPGPSGVVINNGKYFFQLQIAEAGTDFTIQVLQPRETYETPRNVAFLNSYVLVDGEAYEARVRKKWNIDGQVSNWAEISFTEP